MPITGFAIFKIFSKLQKLTRGKFRLIGVLWPLLKTWFIINMPNLKDSKLQI